MKYKDDKWFRKKTVLGGNISAFTGRGGIAFTHSGPGH
jgi:hypothetical protein